MTSSNQDLRITQADLLMPKKRTIDANVVRDKITALKQAQEKSDEAKTQGGESKQQKQMAELARLKGSIKQLEEKRAEKKSMGGDQGGVKKGPGAELKAGEKSVDTKKNNQGTVPAKAGTGGSGGNGYYRDIEGESDDEASEDDYDDNSEGFDDEVRYGQATGQGWL